MAYFYDDCKSLDNWTPIKGSLAIENEKVKVASWNSSGSNRVAQFRVHMFNEPMRAQDNFECKILLDVTLLTTTTVMVEFGDASTNKWAFKISFDLKYTNTVKTIEIRFWSGFSESGEYQIHATADSMFGGSPLFMIALGSISIQQKYLVKDARIQITRPSSGSSTAFVSSVECAMSKSSVTSVQLSDHELESHLYEGDSYLSAIIYPCNADNKNVTWESSNPSVATIAQDGTITPLSLGKTTVTVTTEDGGYTDSCEVVVKYNYFVILLKDYWTRKILNYENTKYPQGESSSYGGFSVYNSDGDGVGGGSLSMAYDGYAEYSGAPLEELGSPPYTYDGSGYMVENFQGTLLLGQNEFFLKSWSYVKLSFWATFDGEDIPIGADFFGGPITIDMQAEDTQGNPLIVTGYGSYIEFDHVKPGMYTAKITGPFFGTEAKYETIEVPIMQQNTIDPLKFYYKLPQLPQVSQPVWAKKVITWKDVANAESYKVILYNADGYALDQKTVSKGIQSYDYTDLIENYLPVGSYMCTVTAMPGVIK